MERLNLLVIDSTSSSLKIAIQINGKVNFFEQTEKSMNHLERLIPLIDKGIKELNEDKKNLDYICVCHGPGSFTGIRVGIATALGIAFAGESSCLGFSSFDVYDYLFRDKKDSVIVPIVDAKKRRFYTTFVNSGDALYYDLSADDIIEKIKDMRKEPIFVGSDFAMMEDKVIDSNINYTFEYQQGYSAKEMLEAAEFFIKNNKISSPDPIYLRKSEAEIALEEKLLKA